MAAAATATDARFDAGRPPSHPHLHARHQTLDSVRHAEYWRQLCPRLHVGDATLVAAADAARLPKRRVKDVLRQVNEAGVAQLDAGELPWCVDLEALGDAVVALVRHGWPPSMVVVYDEVWCMVRQASLLMKEGTGGNACNMDILAWLVDPNRGDVGFSPHRDRQPDDAPGTFRGDGSPMYATMWVPLTRATPENSCLYVIPRPADPGYYEGDPEEEGAPDPLAAALSSKEAYQDIRALPSEPGAALVFTHRTIHWGSKGRPGYPTPRISISWGCADDGFEPPYFARDQLPCPPLGLRLALAGAQMIIYHERFPAPPKQLRLYYEAFVAQAAAFDAAYKAKVMREFVDASKEATAAAAAAAAGAGAGGAPAEPAAGSAGKLGGGAGKKNNKATATQQQRQPDAAAAAAPASSKQQQQEGAKKKRGNKAKARQAAADATEPETPSAAAAAGVPARAAAAGADARNGSKKRHKQSAGTAAAAAAGRRQQQQRKQPPHGAAPDGGVSSSEDDDEGIDFAALAAAAKRHKAAAGAAVGKKAAAAAAAAGAGAAGQDSDDGDDVLDMALECMLDGADGDFADDYDEDD